ncbi:CRISPR-associated ring nuclease Crn3/Csx3 [Adonisia turfae]|uniref:CRISPR-associated protein Csx3 n=1 Tax=Adonisia turfae CCMR0081 TaxID=2292702 RepID=A0A6M0RSI4_9CYAN|nr:CRISPR-associated ring nuclease Crn3/Csx3 [Adonisia turfae]NEZ59126.1 CRISPR-associated protein Csx3 [Adonisia turfae CCMR0081]
MTEGSIRLTLSHHETTEGLAYQLIIIELTSCDRIMEPEVLPTIRLPAGLDPRKGVVIYGRGPMWLYAYLIHECHPTVWVACFDPRLGAVVATTHSKLVSVGQVISLEELNIETLPIESDQLGPALLVVGPPDSGKSIFSHQLFVTLVKDYPDIYLQRAHWDGEGNWILELPENSADSEREAFKSIYKGGLTDRFFTYQGQAIQSLRQQKALVIVDAGGMVQPEKQSLLNACTHYLIISSTPEAIDPWHKFCKNQGNLKPVAVIHSTLGETVQILKHEPFLELRCGPWIHTEPAVVPKLLLDRIQRLITKYVSQIIDFLLLSIIHSSQCLTTP